jgi:hypothetical protein
MSSAAILSVDGISLFRLPGQIQPIENLRQNRQLSCMAGIDRYAIAIRIGQLEIVVTKNFVLSNCIYRNPFSISVALYSSRSLLDLPSIIRSSRSLNKVPRWPTLPAAECPQNGEAF